MNAVEVLLLTFDEAWKGDFESLEDACVDLTEEESVWQPPAYAREPHDKGVGRPGTILWHLNHLEMCHRYYTELLRKLSPHAAAQTNAPGELPLKKSLASLDEATTELRNVIAQLKPEDLTRQVSPKTTAASFVAMFTRHMSWHAGLIKQTRRLCRTKGVPG
jgi:hypothetical protein